MLTELEKKVVAAIQGDIPVSPRPYRDIAERIGTDEQTVLEILKDLHSRGLIRRFGATLRHQKSGFSANAMVAWKVEEARVDEVGEKMAENPTVSHCYRRVVTEKWPYNLYTMIHARDRDTCCALARELSEKTGVKDYTLLFSTRELKKTSMVYFEDELDTEA
ncbi:MAG: Lrp/AsnC family transcriptional regulator [Desulfobacteraceae bacterium]|nr:Lrp/AsnC family transcriptional regulator [Desulfobacteraceae bacterium]